MRLFASRGRVRAFAASAASAAFAAAAAAADGMRLEPLGELRLGPDAPEGLSGVAWLGEGGAFPATRFAFAEDDGGRVHVADLAFDAATGAPTGCVFLAVSAVPGARDLEGVAFDPGGPAGTPPRLFVSDEAGPALFVLPLGADGAPSPPPSGGPARLPVPEALRACRSNLALEALSFDPVRGALWTANEAPLPGDPAGIVRLVRLDAATGRETGSWLYPLEPATGIPLAHLPAPFAGLAGLCALPDGRLLALERIFGYELYDGPDGEPEQSLGRVALSLVSPPRTRLPPGTAPETLSKTVLFSARAGDANWEGVGLGPPLPGGGRLLLLVSDGDVSRRGGLAFAWRKSLLAFRLCD